MVDRTSSAKTSTRLWIDSSEALPLLRRSCTRARRSRVRTMVKAMRIPNRKLAMLARATSTRTSPLFGPIRYDATATMAPLITEGQTADSPWMTEVAVDRSPRATESTVAVRRRRSAPVAPLLDQTGKTAAMAFGQRSGPPASPRQVRELLTLLHSAGHADFRDARGPMGFTQRQAGGMFARDEAAAFIDQLLDAESDREAPVPSPTARQPAHQRMMSHLSSPQLAGELRRRGWTVVEP